MTAKITPGQAAAELERRAQIRQAVFLAMLPQMHQYGPLSDMLKSVDAAVNYIRTGKLDAGKAD